MEVPVQSRGRHPAGSGSKALRTLEARTKVKDECEKIAENSQQQNVCAF